MAANIPPSDLPKPPVLSDTTPRTPRTNAEFSTVPNARPQIVHEMDREFVRCELSAFMERYLPFAPDDTRVLDCVATHLKPVGILTGNDRSLRFTDYMTPPNGSETEMKTYEALEKIGASIAQYQYPNHTHNEFYYRHTPNNHIYSKINGSTHKVDACFTSEILIPGTNKIESKTTSMAIPVEHKLSVKDRHDNNTKVVSANVHIMNEDVRRIFTFGITIECDQVSLWYHSRSHSAVSKPFSFVYHPLLLVKVYISILFATREQLGYDPLVTLEPDFKYTLAIPQGPDKPNRYFRTIDPIIEYRSNNITGRMTRIFHVYEVGSDPRKEFVLKDVWIDKDAQTECQIQGAIFDNIERFWNESPSSNDTLAYFRSIHADLVASKRYKDYFLTIETDHVGNPSCSIADGAIPVRGLFDAPIPFAATPVPQAPASPTQDKPSTSRASRPKSTSTTVLQSEERRSTVGPPRPMTISKTGSRSKTAHPRPPRGYTPRKHYRVVFQERCTSVGDLESLGEVVDVLQQVLTPLQLMLCAGWVHRDISSGNILAFKKDAQSWHVKLSDLEYAKAFPPPLGYKASTDPKTGTPYFMPYEILGKKYLYLRSEDSGVAPSVWDNGIVAPMVDDIVVHNFQHDLESAWWILVWTLTCRIDHAPANEWAKPVFQNTTDVSEGREDYFCTDKSASLADCLADRTKHFATWLEAARRFMFQEYRERVKSGRIREQGSYVFIHEQFIRFFEKLQGIESSIWRKQRLIKNNPYSVPHISDSSGTTTPAADASPDQVPAADAVTPPETSTTAKRALNIAGPARIQLKRALSEEEVEKILLLPQRHGGKRSKGGNPK